MPGSDLFCRRILFLGNDANPKRQRGPAAPPSLALRVSVVSIGLAMMGTTGCADATKPYPVKGTILFEDGQPARDLANYLVSFESPEHHASAVGIVREDGTFQLKTLKENDGAIPGPYRVTLTPPLPAEKQSDRRLPRTKAVKEVIDPRYENMDTTDLAATVELQNNDITLRVKRAKKR